MTILSEMCKKYDGKPCVDEACDGKLEIKANYPWISAVCDTCGLAAVEVDGDPRDEAAIVY